VCDEYDEFLESLIVEIVSHFSPNDDSERVLTLRHSLSYPPLVQDVLSPMRNPACATAHSISSSFFSILIGWLLASDLASN
jgi:hypothetical protein